MNSIKKRIAVGFVGGLFLTSIAATSAFADLDIDGNGARSRNSIRISHSSECEVKQKNKTQVLTTIGSSAHTGGNSASGNTGGDVSVNTGAANTNVKVTVGGSINRATDPCCCECEQCDNEEASVEIKDNGFRSQNHVSLRKAKKKEIRQKNETLVDTLIESRSRTGRNRANHNTRGSVSLRTGRVDSFFDVWVDLPRNTINP